MFLGFNIVAQQKLEVYFDFNRFEINEFSKIRIDSLIFNTKSFQITKIEGYCDATDSDNYNKVLSDNRATKIVDYLKSKNIIFDKNFKKVAVGEEFEQSIVQSKNRKVIIQYVINDIKINEEKVFKNQINASKKGDLIVLKNINFLNNSDEILPKSKSVLEKLLEIMIANLKLKIQIQGHVCCKNTSSSIPISNARAKAIYNFLVKNKIDKTRVSFKGFGTSKPLYPIPERNASEEEQNRRVEILIIEN